MYVPRARINKAKKDTEKAVAKKIEITEDSKIKEPRTEDSKPVSSEEIKNDEISVANEENSAVDNETIA